MVTIPVPRVTQVANGIFSIGPLATSSQSSANAPFLVVGERCAVVEPGERGQALEFLEGVKYLGIDPQRIDYHIPTHIHTHHCTSINVFVKEIPHIKMVVHPRAERHVIDPTKLNQQTTEIWTQGVCSYLDPVPAQNVMAVEDGTVIDLGGRELEIIHAQGHAPHHLAIFDRLTKALWPGDCCSFNEGTKWGHGAIAPPMLGVDEFVDGLHRMRAFKPRMLLGWQWLIGFYPADIYLAKVEENLLAEETLVYECMKQKMPSWEIAEKVRQLSESRGTAGDFEERTRDVLTGAERPRGPVALYRALIKKHPELEMPEMPPEPEVRGGPQIRQSREEEFDSR
ncbi:MAG: MBL fold metallo-hydrolase [Dehalococcoidales bacterium]|nr:MBL fold metallo-hydrolase [Dehalococcoidales bacterium]